MEAEESPKKPPREKGRLQEARENEVAAAQRLIDDLIETSSVSQEDAEAMVDSMLDSIGLTNVPEAHRQEMVKFMRLTNYPGCPLG